MNAYTVDGIEVAFHSVVASGFNLAPVVYMVVRRHPATGGTAMLAFGKLDDAVAHAKESWNRTLAIDPAWSGSYEVETFNVW